jgi:hypothetical protein
MKSSSQAHAATRRSLSDYWPLFALIITAALVASAKHVALDPLSHGTSWMHDFMGIFLVIFALLKIFNLAGFADGFQMYDLLAKRFRPYALVYPFIELALGLGYLAQQQLTLVYTATIIVLGFGALGVIHALRTGLNINCACMGNALSVPLSTVALFENLSMVAMAVIMLISTH